MKAAKFGIVFRFQFICRGNYYRRENNETMIYHSIYDLIMMWSGYGYGGGPTGGSHQNQIQLFNSILVGVTAIYLFSISMADTKSATRANEHEHKSGCCAGDEADAVTFSDNITMLLDATNREHALAMNVRCEAGGEVDATKNFVQSRGRLFVAFHDYYSNKH